MVYMGSTASSGSRGRHGGGSVEEAVGYFQAFPYVLDGEAMVLTLFR